MVRDVPRGAAGGPYTPDAHTVLLYHFDEEKGRPVNSVGRAGQRPPARALRQQRHALRGLRLPGARTATCAGMRRRTSALVCPQTPTLTVSGAGRAPRARSMIHRWITPTALLSCPARRTRCRRETWPLWKLRMRIGGQAFWVCHSFYGYYDRFLKDHPDWFAQGYARPAPPQMCYTNPEFIAQVVQDARDYFDGKGAPPGAAARATSSASCPMDNSSLVQVPALPGRAEPGARRATRSSTTARPATTSSTSSTRSPARSRKTHPDKWIGALAYSDYAYYPDEVDVEPNVVVQMCLHTRNWWCPSMEVNDRKVLADWRDHDPERPLYLWLYYCFPALNAKYGNFHYFPGFFAHSVVRADEAVPRGRHPRHLHGALQRVRPDLPHGPARVLRHLQAGRRPDARRQPAHRGVLHPLLRRRGGADEGALRPHRGPSRNPKYYPPEIQQSPGHQHQTEEAGLGVRWARRSGWRRWAS